MRPTPPTSTIPAAFTLGLRALVEIIPKLLIVAA